MSLKAPDMEKCNPKQRCSSGPNKGLAYDPEDPCPNGYQFDPQKCDCTAQCFGCTDQYYIVVQPNLTGYSRQGSCSLPYVQITSQTTDVYLGPYGCGNVFELEWVFIENSDCGDSGEVNTYILQTVTGGSLWSSGSPGSYTNDYWEGPTPTIDYACALPPPSP